MRVQLSSIKPDIKEIAKNNVHLLAHFFFHFGKCLFFSPPHRNMLTCHEYFNCSFKMNKYILKSLVVFISNAVNSYRRN